MATYKKTFNNIDKITDHQTGEVITTSKSFTIQVKHEEFFMVFLTQLGSFYQLRSAVDILVLSKFCELADFNSSHVALTPARRKKIMEELDISSQQITNSIRNLKSKNLITGEDGDFDINPAVFWKGSLDERRKLLDSGKLKFEVNFVSEKTALQMAVDRKRQEAGR